MEYFRKINVALPVYRKQAFFRNWSLEVSKNQMILYYILIRRISYQYDAQKKNPWQERSSEKMDY